MSGHECDDALTNLYQYLDREIEASTSDCSGCLKSFDFEARLQIVVRERLAEDVPDEFVQRLRDAIAREAASS